MHLDLDESSNRTVEADAATQGCTFQGRRRVLDRRAQATGTALDSQDKGTGDQVGQGWSGVLLEVFGVFTTGQPLYIPLLLPFFFLSLLFSCSLFTFWEGMKEGREKREKHTV